MKSYVLAVSRLVSESAALSAGHSQLYPARWHKQMRTDRDLCKMYKLLPGQVSEEDLRKWHALGCFW